MSSARTRCSSCSSIELVDGDNLQAWMDDERPIPGRCNEVDQPCPLKCMQRAQCEGGPSLFSFPPTTAASRWSKYTCSAGSLFSFPHYRHYSCLVLARARCCGGELQHRISPHITKADHTSSCGRICK